MSLKVTQDRAIVLSFAFGPVVNAQHPRRTAYPRRIRRTANHSKQGICRPFPKVQRLRQPPTPLAAHSKGNSSDRVVQTVCATRAVLCQPRKLLRKNTPWAGAVVAKKLAHPNHELQGLIAQGQIMQRATVAAQSIRTQFRRRCTHYNAHAPRWCANAARTLCHGRRCSTSRPIPAPATRRPSRNRYKSGIVPMRHALGLHSG